MLGALHGCSLTCNFQCIGCVAAAHRAVEARSEGLAEAQQVRAELLRISARLNATSSPSMTARVEVASTAPIAATNRLLHSHEAATMYANTSSASHFRTRTRVGEGLHPGLPATPDRRRILSPAQAALETPVALASVL
jgi:hypothetical protein